MIVSEQDQIAFLNNIQRLLSEGQFTATYKFALILALADIAIEQGDENGGQELPTARIAEKFIQYYWRQIRPFTPSQGEPFLLRQNFGTTAAVIRELTALGGRGISSLADLQADARRWNSLVARVRQTVCNQPLRYLPTLGPTRHAFLYEDDERIRAGKVVETIRLLPGVMFCFRRFYGLVSDLVRGAWVRYARRYNADLLGAPADLDEFLFGSERSSLESFVPVLREVQAARCFYCGRAIQSEQAHVDHFIPWSRYPVDLGHNFVLAHSACNSAKADHLASLPHLEHWLERNRTTGEQLASEFDRLRLLHSRHASTRVAQWAYEQAGVGALTWAERAVFEQLPGSWMLAFSRS